MRILIALTLTLALAWAGWWVLGSRLALRGAEAAFAAAPAAGWQASHAGIAIAGFPSRFDLTVTEPAIARDGWGWRGSFLQVFALAYDPQNLILAFPPEQTVTLPSGEMRLTAEGMRASLAIDRAGPALDEAILEARTFSAGDIAGSALELALRRDPAAPGRYRAFARVASLDLPQALRPGGLPPGPARAEADGYIVLTEPLDRSALAAPPALARIEITRASLVWGGLMAGIDGRLAPDAAGLAAGELRLRLSDPAVAGDILARAGLLPQGAVPPAEVTLSFTGGRIRLGPFDLGPAPRLGG